MVSWSAMRNRVYALTDLDSGRASSTVVDGWLKRAIVEVSALVDTIPQFWDSLNPLEAVHSTTVNSGSWIADLPSDFIRIHPSIQIANRRARMLTGGSLQATVKDEIHQPTVESPQVCIIAGGTGTNYHVYPESFSGKGVKIRYIKEAVGDESFAEDAAEAFAIKASEIGMNELGEAGGAADMEKLYAKYVSTLAKGAA